jgi:hypothetical protein
MDPAIDPAPQQSTPPPGVTFGAPTPATPPAGVTFGPPAGATSGPPPGVTFGSPATASVNPLAINAKGEGVYKMAAPDGGNTIAIPYSNVPAAMKAGYGITDPAEQQRFMKDRSSDPNTSTMNDLLEVLIKHPVHALKENAKGLLKNEAQVPMTIAGWMDAGESHLRRLDEIISGKSNKTAEDLITGNDPNQVHQARDDVKAFLEAHAPGITNAPIGPQQQRGALIGNVAEFAGGEKVLGELTKTLPWMVEGGNYADKLKVVQPILKIAAEHPRIAAMLGAAASNATVGGTQAALHGATLPEAGKSAAIAGGVAALGEGIGQGFQELREGAQARAAATAAHEAAPAVQAERTAAMTTERQATAQGQVKDVAQQATQDALDRLNEARTPTTTTTPGASVPARPGADTIDEGIRAQNARRELGSMAATIPDRLLPRNPIVEELGHRAGLIPDRIWDEVGNPAPVQTTTGPRFQPIDSEAHAAEVSSFGAGAEKLREAAQPVYQKVDTATGGQFAKLQKARAAAFAAKDFGKVAETDGTIDELLSSRPKDVTPEDYAAAKSAWRDSKVLDKLHAATEGAFNGISEDMAAQPGTAPRLLKGGDSQAGSLQKRIGSLLRKPKDAADVERVIGKDGIANLYRASHLVSTPELRAQTQAIADAVAKEFPAPAETHPVVQAIKDSVVGGAVGTGLNYLSGGHVPASVSAPLGAAATNGARYVLRKMVMSPRIGQLMDFAVRNQVAPRIAAPLIAAEIRKEQGQPKKEESTQ